jgi:hypothetical protein
MAANTKRLDLRFGSFACSVQGFDDPVMPVQQVLRAIQHLLEETPELSDAGISFDAEAIENLIEEVARRADLAAEDVEITPGLIIVHRGENEPVAEYPGDETGTEREAWSRPFTGGKGNGADAGGAEQPAYVNIFAQQGEGGGGDFAAIPDSDADAVVEAPEETTDLVADRLSRAYEDAPEPEDAATGPAGLRDIFAETADAGGGVFTDPMAPAGADMMPEDDDPEPLNLFATSRLQSPDVDQPRAGGNIFAEFATQGDAGADPSGDDEAGRVQTLFGDTGDQPEPEEAGDGYTVAGLAKAAGADSVSDMMVSAAAWLVMLQGVTSFTRRQVMDAFDQIPGEHEKSLEARIKGFGKATRNGQIVMIKDGVFGLSQDELDRFERLL